MWFVRSRSRGRAFQTEQRAATRTRKQRTQRALETPNSSEGLEHRGYEGTAADDRIRLKPERTGLSAKLKSPDFNP